jgi:hypothetical protein
MDGPLEILLRVARVLESLPARYVVGGSFASSARGMIRATNDVDLITDLRVEQILRFAAALREEFYIDESSARRAVETHRSFNLYTSTHPSKFISSSLRKMISAGSSSNAASSKA